MNPEEGTPVAEADPYKSLLDLLDCVESLLPENYNDRGIPGERLNENRVVAYSKARQGFLDAARSRFGPSLGTILVTGNIEDFTTALLKHVPESKYLGFREVSNEEDEVTVKAALASFITIGKSLRKAENGFENSIVHNLQEMILNLREHGDRFMSDCKVDNASLYKVQRAFIALAAPSFVGKTQAAFTIDEEVLKVLYIPVASTQPIYENFSHLISDLVVISLLDKASLVDTVRNGGANNPLRDRIQLNTKDHGIQNIIRTENLCTYFPNYPFWTLGLIKAIIVDSHRNYEIIKQKGWMVYLSELGGLEYERCTINQLSSLLKDPKYGKFALFLDEFVGSDHLVLVRNLARAVGICCVVANTNSQIANLIGSTVFSGHGAYNIWSLVITRLDLANKKVLDESYGFSDRLQLLKRYIERPYDADQFAKWFKNNIETTRPGIAAQFALAMSRFIIEHPNELGKWTVAGIMNYLLNEVGARLRMRKRDNNFHLTRCGNLGLLGPEAFEENVLVNVASVNEVAAFHRPQYLADHFYYLCNPTRAGDWKYLTILQNSDVNVLDLYHFAPDGSLQNTTNNTFFSGDERLAILACMFMVFRESVYWHGVRALVNDPRPGAIFTQKNSNSVKNDGNYLECLAAFAVAEASHLFYNERGRLCSSIDPKNGKLFIEVVLANFLYLNNALFSHRPLNRHPEDKEFGVLEFLHSCKVPFIYALNQADPEMEYLNLQLYSRPADSAEIDGKLEITVDNHPEFASIECKNMKKAVGTPLVTDIIGKAKGCKLAVIVCAKMIQNRTLMSTMAQFCRDNYVSLYRYMEEDDTAQGKISHTFKPLYLTEGNPDTICLVIELDTVNSKVSGYSESIRAVWPDYGMGDAESEHEM